MNIIAHGDLHLDGSQTPICRTDDYYQTQVNKLQFINEVCEKYDAIRIDAGDFLNLYNGRTAAQALKTFKLVAQNVDHFYGVVGNHPLKKLSQEYLEESLISAFIDADIMTLVDKPILLDDKTILYGFDYEQPIAHTPPKYSKDSYCKIAMYHGYVDLNPDIHIEGLIASEIVSEFKDDYHFIITSDNHTPFVYTEGGCTLINTGSLLRTTIKQIDYEPGIWLINTDDNTFTEIKVPILKDVISTEHKDVVVNKKNTMESVVNIIKSSGEVSLSFERELEDLIKANEDVVNERVLDFVDTVTEKYEEYIK